MIGQMAIVIALLGFNDLGRSVTPTFLFRNRFYLQLSRHCSKMNEKSMWEVKRISRFLSTGHTPNANMADHSVGARDEYESEASEASVFCF